MSGEAVRDSTPAALGVLGLTGAPGSGKSAVAGLLEKRGAVVVDADRLAREAWAEPEVIAAAVDWWGPGVVNASGAVDRAAVAAIVFGNPAERKRLEALLHPRVAEGRRVLHAAAAASPAARFVVEDSPLLIESGLHAHCDAVWLVEAPRAVRLKRVAQRGWSPDELARREAAQADPAVRKAHASFRLRNDCSIENLQAQVDSGLLAWPLLDAGATERKGCG